MTRFSQGLFLFCFIQFYFKRMLVFCFYSLNMENHSTVLKHQLANAYCIFHYTYIMTKIWKKILDVNVFEFKKMTLGSFSFFLSKNDFTALADKFTCYCKRNSRSLTDCGNSQVLQACSDAAPLGGLHLKDNSQRKFNLEVWSLFQ